MDRSVIPDSRYRVPISPVTVPRVLTVCVVLLIAIHLTLQIAYYVGGFEPLWDIRLLFDVDEEPSAPTWYSTVALLLAALLSVAVAGAKKRQGDRDARYWYGLAIGMLAMSLDEIAALHEMFNTYADVDWTIPGAILVALLAVPYLRFLSRLPPRPRWRFLTAAIVFVGGVLGVEYVVADPLLFPYRMDSLPYNLMVALEEGMEMTGVVIYVQALLAYMAAEAAADGRRGEAVILEIEP